jgi:hypothetical protein
MNVEELPEEDNAMWSDFLAPVKEDASTISVSTFQPSNELIDSQDKMSTHQVALGWTCS